MLHLSASPCIARRSVDEKTSLQTWPSQGSTAEENIENEINWVTRCCVSKLSAVYLGGWPSPLLFYCVPFSVLPLSCSHCLYHFPHSGPLPLKVNSFDVATHPYVHICVIFSHMLGNVFHWAKAPKGSRRRRGLKATVWWNWLRGACPTKSMFR